MYCVSLNVTPTPSFKIALRFRNEGPFPPMRGNGGLLLYLGRLMGYASRACD